MKTPPRWPQLTAEEMRDRLWMQPSAIEGVLMIREMDDLMVLGAARRDTTNAHREICARLGDDTNPNWTVAMCAHEALDRGLIDEQEHDFLTR